MLPLILLLAAPAASLPYSPAYEQCLSSGDAAQGIQPAMEACVAEEFDRQDARLNQAYVMRMRGLPPKRRAELRTAQRSWLASKPKRCPYEASGQLDRMLSNQCSLRDTIQRRVFLERYR